jgi:twitching motility protein PilU
MAAAGAAGVGPVSQLALQSLNRKLTMTAFQALLQLMVSKGASDLFLTAGATPRLKIEGATHPVEAPVLKRGEVKSMAASIMDAEQAAAFERTLESNMSLAVEGVGRFRINVFQQRGEVAMVVRAIKSEVPALDQLGLPAACTSMAMTKRGLVLFVGSAGSGKSTSLAAMIGYRSNNADGHILTIEDPIEFLFRHRRSLVDQREVNIDTHSFGEALRNALRESPDVIMIGEIRDLETARHAITYAETGHLCLSTMNASNAYEAIERLVSFFPDDARKALLLDLSLNLKAVVGQRLLPSTGGKLALATEVLLQTPFVAELIQHGRIEEIRDAMAKGNDVGMRTFDQSLFELYGAGRVTLDNALRFADSQTDLSLRIRLSEKQAPAEQPDLTVEEITGIHHTRK